MGTSQPEPSQFISLLKRALAEDIGSGDVTSQTLIDDDLCADGVITAKQGGILAGLIVLAPLAGLVDESLEAQSEAVDGQTLQAGQEVARISGPARGVLAIERVGLNFLGHLSGIATLTSQFVEAVAGSSAVICDTRKTIPGLRMLEKYAVAIGGGHNHRLGLYDAAMIKDNHLLCLARNSEAGAMEVLRQRLAELRRQLPAEGFVQLEVDNLQQFQQVLGLKLDVDMVLLDNFSTEDLVRAVGMRNDAGLGEKLLLEASGSVRLETVRQIAESGVDRISVGALTHSAAALDFSMEFVLK